MKIPIIERLIRTAEGYNLGRPYQIRVPRNYPKFQGEYADGITLIQSEECSYTLESPNGTFKLWLGLLGSPRFVAYGEDDMPTLVRYEK